MMQQGGRGVGMADKHRITVNLDDDEYQALQRLALDADRSLAWLGRRAICDLIERCDEGEGRVPGLQVVPDEKLRRSAR